LTVVFLAVLVDWNLYQPVKRCNLQGQEGGKWYVCIHVWTICSSSLNY